MKYRQIYRMDTPPPKGHNLIVNKINPNMRPLRSCIIGNEDNHELHKICKFGNIVKTLSELNEPIKHHFGINGDIRSINRRMSQQLLQVSYITNKILEGW